MKKWIIWGLCVAAMFVFISGSSQEQEFTKTKFANKYGGKTMRVKIVKGEELIGAASAKAAIEEILIEKGATISDMDNAPCIVQTSLEESSSDVPVRGVDGWGCSIKTVLNNQVIDVQVGVSGRDTGYNAVTNVQGLVTASRVAARKL